MIVLSEFEQGLLLKLRTFERHAARAQITDEQRKKWLFWADIFQDEISYKSDFLKCVLDRYIHKIRTHKRAVLSLHPILELEGLPRREKKQQHDDQPPGTFQRQVGYRRNVTAESNSPITGEDRRRRP